MKKVTKLTLAVVPALAFGQIGLAHAGTCAPPCEVEGTNPEIQMLDTSTGGQDWEIEANPGGFEIDQEGGGTPAFKIENAAGNDMLVLDDNGNVGINTDEPQSTNELEVSGSGGAGDTFVAIAMTPQVPSDNSGARMTVNTFSEAFTIGVNATGTGYKNPVAIDLGAGNNILSISSGDRVGIGGLTTTQINTASTLHVEGSGGIAGNVFLDNIGSQDDWLIDPAGTGLLFRNGATTLSPAVVKFGSPAPVASLVVETDTGDVGIGLASPTADLHVVGEGVLDTDSNAEQVLRMESLVPPEMVWANTALGNEWAFRMTLGNNFNMNYNGSRKFTFFKNGNLTIVGALTELSDRESKAAVAPVDNRKILDAVVDLPIASWEYKSNEGVRHLGPMAQDFHAAFGLGDTPKGISSIDTGGVALAAIKGLNEVGQSRDTEIQSLKAESMQLKKANEEIMTANEDLAARLEMLENLVNKLAAKEVVMNR